MNTEIIISTLVGLIAGAWLVIAGLYIFMNYDENRYKKKLAIEQKLKEIEVRTILNDKINEILNRPIKSEDYDLIDPKIDIKLPFQDYNFLKNFTSMYHLYLPGYFLENFFKNLSHRLSVFSDEQDLQNGGYIFKDSRSILENFSNEIVEDIEHRKHDLEKLHNVYPAVLKRQYFEFK
jgi:hypothetical protein